jgi:hypothetical protein
MFTDVSEQRVASTENTESHSTLTAVGTSDLTKLTGDIFHTAVLGSDSAGSIEYVSVYPSCVALCR